MLTYLLWVFREGTERRIDYAIALVLDLITFGWIGLLTAAAVKVLSGG